MLIEHALPEIHFRQPNHRVHPAVEQGGLTEREHLSKRGDGSAEDEEGRRGVCHRMNAPEPVRASNSPGGKN